MFSTSKVIPEIIGDIVDSIRETGVVTNVQQNGIYQILTTNVQGLLINSVIEINSKTYVIQEVTSNTIKIESSGIIVNDEWKSLAPYYEYGSLLETCNKLTEKDNTGGNFQYQKYPLITLVTDIENNRTEKQKLTANVTFFIITNTRQEFKSERRYDETFEPVLIPLHEKFVTALERSKYLSQNNHVSHTEIHRLFWGRDLPEYNNEDVMNDFIDAIEMRNTQLKFNISKCH